MSHVSKSFFLQKSGKILHKGKVVIVPAMKTA
jgi:hypothetical protein